MKKLLLLALMIPIFQLAKAQEEIVKWTFPNNALGDTIQNGTNPLNLNQVLRAEGTSAIAMKNGATTYAAQATNWDNGMGVKNWNIRFKTTGYKNVKISSKQQGGGNNGGPVDFKIQYKIGIAGSWGDVTGGTITLVNNWTTGVVSNLDLPAECQNQSDLVYIRWIMTSNNDINGGSITAAGVTKIDDIVVTGVLQTGINHIGTSYFKTFPNPSASTFTVSVPEGTQKIEVYNNIGKLVYETIPVKGNNIIDESLPAGLYFVKITVKGRVDIVKHIIR